jgi:hypothetical protein
VGTTKANALEFIMIDPPTDITLPDTPSDKSGTTFLGYKTFKVLEPYGQNTTTDTFLVISNGILTLKKWEDLTVDELPTMIMAFYKKDAKSCYSNETWYEKDANGDRKPESERRYINNQCSSIISSSGGVTTADKIDNKDACEKCANCAPFIYDSIKNIGGVTIKRGSNCEWRNPTIWDL